MDQEGILGERQGNSPTCIDYQGIHRSMCEEPDCRCEQFARTNQRSVKCEQCEHAGFQHRAINACAHVMPSGRRCTCSGWIDSGFNECVACAHRKSFHRLPRNEISAQSESLAQHVSLAVRDSLPAQNSSPLTSSIPRLSTSQESATSSTRQVSTVISSQSINETPRSTTTIVRGAPYLRAIVNRPSMNSAYLAMGDRWMQQHYGTTGDGLVLQERHPSPRTEIQSPEQRETAANVRRLVNARLNEDRASARLKRAENSKAVKVKKAEYRTVAVMVKQRDPRKLQLSLHRELNQRIEVSVRDDATIHEFACLINQALYANDDYGVMLEGTNTMLTENLGQVWQSLRGPRLSDERKLPPMRTCSVLYYWHPMLEEIYGDDVSIDNDDIPNQKRKRSSGSNLADEGLDDRLGGSYRATRQAERRSGTSSAVRPKFELETPSGNGTGGTDTTITRNSAHRNGSSVIGNNRLRMERSRATMANVEESDNEEASPATPAAVVTSEDESDDSFMNGNTTPPLTTALQAETPIHPSNQPATSEFIRGFGYTEDFVVMIRQYDNDNRRLLEWLSQYHFEDSPSAKFRKALNLYRYWYNKHFGVSGTRGMQNVIIDRPPPVVPPSIVLPPEQQAAQAALQQDAEEEEINHPDPILFFHHIQNAWIHDSTNWAKEVNVTFNGERGIGVGVKREYENFIRTLIFDMLAFEGNPEARLPTSNVQLLNDGLHRLTGLLFGNMVLDGVIPSVGIHSALKEMFLGGQFRDQTVELDDVPDFALQSVLKKLRLRWTPYPPMNPSHTAEQQELARRQEEDSRRMDNTDRSTISEAVAAGNYIGPRGSPWFTTNIDDGRHALRGDLEPHEAFAALASIARQYGWVNRSASIMEIAQGFLDVTHLDQFANLTTFNRQQRGSIARDLLNMVFPVVDAIRTIDQLRAMFRYQSKTSVPGEMHVDKEARHRQEETALQAVAEAVLAHLKEGDTAHPLSIRRFLAWASGGVIQSDFKITWEAHRTLSRQNTLTSSDCFGLIGLYAPTLGNPDLIMVILADIRANTRGAYNVY